MKAWVPLLALGLMLAACAESAPRSVDFGETRYNYRAQDYPGVLETWTRHQKVVRDIGTVIEVWATLKSWEFRQAYVEQYMEVYDVPEAQSADFFAAELKALREAYEFHVVAQSTSFAWNDLDQKKTAWRVTLVDAAGVSVEPTSLQVQKLPEPYESLFFPYRTGFTRSYLIRFARDDVAKLGFTGPKSGRIVLRIVGPLGKAELLWQAKSG
jgi:hypothetical protein